MSERLDRLREILRARFGYMGDHVEAELDALRDELKDKLPSWSLGSTGDPPQTGG
jgi:hypothetical protein